MDRPGSARRATASYLLFEQTSREVEDLRLRRDQTGRDAAAIEGEIGKARAAKVVWDRASNDHKTATAEADGARSKYEALDQKIKSIRDAESDQKRLEDEIRAYVDDQPAIGRAVQEAERAEAGARRVAEDVRREQDALDTDQNDLVAAEKRAGLCTQLDTQRKRLEQLDEARGDLERKQQERRLFVAPDAAHLRKVRAEFKIRDGLRTQLDAALITLEFVPETSASLRVVVGQPAGEHAVTAGSVTRVKGSPEVAVDLVGFGRIRARGPSESAQELQPKLAKSEGKLRALTEGFGVTEQDDLEALALRAAELDRAVSDAQVRFDTLRGDDDVDELRSDLRRSEATVAEINAAHPDWLSSAPDVEALRQTLTEKRAACRERSEVTGALWRKTQAELNAAHSASTIAAERLDTARKNARQLAERLTQLLPAPWPEADRVKELGQLALGTQAADEALRQAQARLDAFDDDPSGILSILENQLQTAKEESDRAREQAMRKEAQLEALAAAGSYSRMVSKEEEVRALRERLRSEELRMAAIRLLRDTVQECKREAIAAVAAPVEQSATRLLRRIAGTRLGTIQIGERFIPTGLHPELADHVVGVDQASGGEQEQIHLATRLALAEVIAHGRRELVVLDDILVATDPGRLARILRILEETADSMQILVLTCHPERYRGMSRATYIDLVEVA